MKQLPLFTAFLLLSACATTPHLDYYYNEIVIRNNSTESVTNVLINAEISNAVFSCSIIHPGTVCSNKFQKRRYLGNPIQISWSFHNARRMTEQFILTVQDGLATDIPLRGVLEIGAGGIIKPYFEQDTY